jgi:catechol 2,3-dioxygenase-like lactoylglutathione lyase family enzyme
MLLGIDHIVIAVRDLDTAARNYEELGFTVVPGGRHPVGTHNALISFPDGSYIEIIAFYRPNADHRWWKPLQRGEGLVDFCMQTNDLLGDTLKLRKAGVAINDPVPWSRTRPDGYQLKWLLSLAREGHRGVAPFLIQDETPREERIPQQTAHENSAIGIGAVTVAVDDLATVSLWYKNVLGRNGESIERKELQATGVRFQVGPHLLEFLQPVKFESPIADWLHARGPSPYSATLKSRSDKGVPLDENLTHGAGLSLV